MDAGRLDDGANRAAGDDARSLRRGAEEHLARAEVPVGLVGNGHALERHLEDVLARLVVALADRLGHFVGLPEADAHVTALVADDHEGRKREATAALDDLRDAVDVDDALLELLVVNLLDSHLRTPDPLRGRPRREP